MHSVNGNSFTVYIFNVVLYANLYCLKIYCTSVNQNKQGKNTVAVRWVIIPNRNDLKVLVLNLRTHNILLCECINRRLNTFWLCKAEL